MHLLEGVQKDIGMICTEGWEQRSKIDDALKKKTWSPVFLKNRTWSYLEILESMNLLA